MKLKGRLVSVVLAVMMLVVGFAMPKKAEATEYPSKQYVCNGYNVEVKVTDEYENMFHGEVILTNTGYDTIRDWTFSCQFGHKITNIWNAKVVKAENGTCVITNADWNQNIAPGATASFGFIAEKTENGEIVFPEGFAMGMKEAAADNATFAVEFVVYSDWGEGNTGAFILKNLTDKRIHNWKLSFAYDREIVSIANAVIESYAGGVYTLCNADYNADLEPYGTVHISFNGGKGKGEQPASNFALIETVYEKNEADIPVLVPNTISGKVTEVVSGGALSAATVKVMQNNVVVSTTTTDGNGTYSFRLYDGTYTLLVSKEHYETAEVVFVSKADAKGPDVALKQKAYTVTGKVTDKADGKALAGVKITVKDAKGIVTGVVTKEDGTYSVELLHKEYQLAFAAENYETLNVTVVGGEKENVSVALEKIAVSEDDKKDENQEDKDDNKTDKEEDKESQTKPVPGSPEKFPYKDLESFFEDYKSSLMMLYQLLTKLFAMKQ